MFTEIMHFQCPSLTVLDLVLTCFILLYGETKGQDFRGLSDLSDNLSEIKSISAHDGNIELVSQDNQLVDLQSIDTNQQDLTDRSDRPSNSLKANAETYEIKSKNNNIGAEDKPGIYLLTEKGIEKCDNGLSLYENLMGHKTGNDEYDPDVPQVIYSSDLVQVIRPPQRSRRSRAQHLQTRQAPTTYIQNLSPNNGYQNMVNVPTNVNSKEASLYPVNQFTSNQNQQIQQLASNAPVYSFSSNLNQQPLQDLRVNQPSPVSQPFFPAPSNGNSKPLSQPVYVNQQQSYGPAIQHAPYKQIHAANNRLESDSYYDDYAGDYDDDDDAWYDEVYSDNDEDYGQPYLVQPYRRQHNESTESHEPTKHPAPEYQVYTTVSPPPGSNTTNATCPCNSTVANTTACNKTTDAVVLKHIMQELDCIKTDRVINASAEGSPCDIAGSWVSEAAGVRFDITSNASGYLTVDVGDITPPRKKGFMLSGGWSISGESPFIQGGPFYLTATQDLDKRIALFIGECHICQLEDLVTGSWVTSRVARDCRDTFISSMGKTDIFHRESLHVLRDERKTMFGCPTKKPPPTTVEPIGSTKCTTPKPCKKHHKMPREGVEPCKRHHKAAREGVEPCKRHHEAARERRRHSDRARHRSRVMEEEEEEDDDDDDDDDYEGQSDRRYRRRHRYV